jgi:hypothetical protein
MEEWYKEGGKKENTKDFKAWIPASAGMTERRG